MSVVFLDTVGLIAQWDTGDQWHVLAEAAYQQIVVQRKREKDERWDDMLAGRWGVDGEVDPQTFKAVVVEAVERVIAANGGKTVAVVCHGGVINAYFAHLLGLDFPMFFEPAYTSISRVLASSAGQRQVKSINEHAHVRALI